MPLHMMRSALCQGLLTKSYRHRLGWPQLLDHPFVKETAEERRKRESLLVQEQADREELTWKGEVLRPGEKFCTTISISAGCMLAAIHVSKG